MANIILPQVNILNEIDDSTKLIVEQNGEINRYPISDLDIGGGDVTIDLNGDNQGAATGINADTLGGFSADDFIKQGDYVFTDKVPKAGFIYPLASEVVPDGFLLCDGAEYSRTEYPELFAAIGIIYGAGDGSTTFNVPSLATRVPIGAGGNYGLGNTGGEEKHTMAINEMPSHIHNGITYANTGLQVGLGNGTTDYRLDWTASAGSSVASLRTASTGGSQAFNIMQPYIVVNYIIATGKNTGVSVADIITGAQALPLGIEYGGTGATTAEMARENIGAMSMELLWENASPDSAFDEHTGNSAITFQEGNGAYLIEFYGIGSATASETKIIFPNKVSTLLSTFISEDKPIIAGSRKVTPTNKSIEFGSGIYSTNGVTEVGTTNNTVCKPLRIWRLRGV